MNNSTATVHVVDDDISVRNFLSEVLCLENYQVKTYESAQDFLDNFNHDGVGCLVIDLRLPGINGLDLQQELFARNIDLPFVIITGHGDIPTAVRAMKAGAMDFIEKPIAAQVLLDRVKKCVETHHKNRQQQYIRSDILQRMETLTAREREVMDLVVDGHQNKDIAAKLGISIKTVEVHRANTMDKMNASSVVELVRMSLSTKK